ncbi:MAG: polysaccharide biosynthesis C-terminal domain-containing protein [Candidatus Latescibacterota bacterium]|nr:polysaccharide biosynthesis C-terminal domain-containing protein [Candidatus Latescibacterota bacterium]
MADSEIEDTTTVADIEASSVEQDIRDLAGGALVVYLGKAARISRGAFIWVISLLCGLDVQYLYSLAWAAVSTANKVARFGLQRGIVRFVTGVRVNRHEIGGLEAHRPLAAGLIISLLASSMVAIAVFLGADLIARIYERDIATAIRIMAFTAPFLSLSWVFTSAIRALRIMRYEVYVRSIAGPLFLFVGGTALGLAGLGLEAIAWVQLGMGVVNFLLAAFYFRMFFSVSISLRAVTAGPPLRRLARFSAPVMGTDVLKSVLLSLDVFMIGHFLRDDALGGLYLLARRTASAMLKAPQAFDAIFSSVASELSHQNRVEDLGHRFIIISRWILVINLPIFACLLLVGRPLLEVIGAKYIGEIALFELGLTVLFILCIGMMIQGLFAISEPLLTMSGWPGISLFNNLVWLGVYFGLNVWLIPRHGIVGVALGASFSMALVSLLRVVEIHRLRGVLPFRRSQLKPVIAGAIASIPAVAVRDPESGLLWELVLPPATFLAVYVVGLRWLGLEEEERALFAALRRRFRRRSAGNL